MNWEEVHIAALHRLNALGYSASGISQRLNEEFGKTGVRFTRNSVIGKLARGGMFLMGRRNHGYRAPGSPCRVPTPRLIPAVKLVEAPPPLEPVAMQLDGHSITILTLQNGMCKWAHGEVTSEFYFCGWETKPGEPYCAHHRARAWTGTTQSQRARVRGSDCSFGSGRRFA